MRFAIWSNGFYLVPLLVAGYFGLWWMFVPLLALLMCSSAFHLSGEKYFVLSDIFAATTVAAVSILALHFGGLKLAYAAATAVFVITALYIRYGLERGNRGGVYHGLWHLIVASAVLICIAAYVL